MLAVTRLALSNVNRPVFHSPSGFCRLGFTALGSGGAGDRSRSTLGNVV